MFSCRHLLKTPLSCRQVFLWINLGIGLNTVCYSQTISTSDSVEYRAQFEFFDDVVGIENTEIINGPKHILRFPGSGTHPFYNSAIGVQGSVAFAGQPYFNITLLYDIYLDELVVQALRKTGTRELLVVNKGKVESFRMYGHTFRNYEGTSAQDVGLVNGFYDVLYESAVFTLMAKRTKHTKVEMGAIQFESEDKYLFIRPGRKAAPFRGVNGFYQVLGDKESKADLKAFVKVNDLKIMKSDTDLIKAARYCDTILSRRK
jgi:hypothetical protein